MLAPEKYKKAFLFKISFSVTLIFIAWFILTKVIFKLPQDDVQGVGIQERLTSLGKMSIEERRVLLVFGLTASCWLLKRDVINLFLPQVTDTVIAIAGGLSLFIIPDGNNGKLIDWSSMKKVPWGILLLFGGGLSIANAFIKTDLAVWIGGQLNAISEIHLFLLIILVSLLVNFLTEFTSNLATSSMILPILAALAVSIGLHPYYLMVAAILAASCAFMLPVATAPNAIVFGSRQLDMNDMIRTGMFLNILSTLLITVFIYVIMPYLWDLNLTEFIK